MTFAPYTPPNAGDGPIDNAGRDITHRLETNGLVTPQVVAAVAWLLEWGHLTAREEATILHGLGLEWVRTPMGGRLLQPMAIYRKEVTTGLAGFGPGDKDTLPGFGPDDEGH